MLDVLGPLSGIGSTSVTRSNLGRGGESEPNPAYPESNFESFEIVPSQHPLSKREEKRREPAP